MTLLFEKAKREQSFALQSRAFLSHTHQARKGIDIRLFAFPGNQHSLGYTLDNLRINLCWAEYMVGTADEQRPLRVR